MGNSNIYLNNFPLQHAVKVDDLIYYDMPILSRYNFNDKSYLYYHVDDENNLDTYLVFKIEEYDLFKLISGKVSLRNTILNINDFLYIIDKDNSDMIVKTSYLFSTDIIDDYLPDEDSILDINFIEGCYYDKLIEKYQPQYYTETLRKSAFYLKFSSKTSKYGDTLGLEELSNTILPSITAAYKNYAKFDFINKFKEQFTDLSKLNRIFNKLTDDIELRMVDTCYGSFEIGIAPDTLMQSSSENVKVKDWALTVGENFKEDVLDINLENSDEFEKITVKFDEEQRVKIFKPIIELANDKNINFLFKASKNTKYKIIKNPSRQVIEKLIPVKKDIEEKDLELELVQFTGVIEKGKKISINPSNSLFSSLEETQLVLNREHFAKYGYKLKLMTGIPVLISQKGIGKIELFATYDHIEFSVTMDSTNLESAVEKLIKKIYEYYFERNSR